MVPSREVVTRGSGGNRGLQLGLGSECLGGPDSHYSGSPLWASQEQAHSCRGPAGCPQQSLLGLLTALSTIEHFPTLSDPTKAQLPLGAQTSVGAPSGSVCQ